jgi:hypothetical protein
MPGADAPADEPRWVFRHVEGVVYILAAVTYIAASLVWKGLLNWIVGPAWLLVWVGCSMPLIRRSRAGL